MTRNPIFDLLPTVFRQADIGQGDPLRALTDIFMLVDGELHAGVDELYEAWFIQTCPLAWVPMIGALVGVALPTPVRLEHRALVADALAVRRRKGVAAALPILLRGASGWYALPLTADGDVPGAAWPLLASDANGAVPSASASITALDGAPSGGLWVWRLPVFPLEGVTPAPVAPPSGWPRTWTGWFRRYWLNPLGLAAPLWNVAGSVLPLGPAPVTALPVQTGRDMLARDLARQRKDWPVAGPGAPADSRLYGPGRGLLLSEQNADGTWRDVPPLGLRAMALAPFELPPPDFPVFLSGELDLTTLKALTYAMKVTLGDTVGTLAVTLGDAPSLAEAAKALQTALDEADITQAGTVPADALTDATVWPWGTQLAVIPARGLPVPLTFAAPTGSSPPVVDPLLLINGASAVRALRTAPLDDALLARLCACPPGDALRFSDADGQAYAVTLPLDVPAPATVPGVAAALRAALPGTLVLVADDRVLIVPAPPGQKPSGPQPPPTAAMAALAWDLGLTRAPVLDPETGACAWPAAGIAPTTISASYGYAAPMGLGGGLYPRAVQAHPASATAYPVAPSGPASFSALMSQWTKARPAWAVFTPVGSGVFPMAATLYLGTGQTFMIQAGSQQRPLITTSGGALAVSGPGSPTAPPGALRLDGLLWRGGLSITGGTLALTLTDVTLYATGNTPALALTPKAPTTPAPTLTFSAERCILAPIDAASLAGTLAIADSILGPLSTPFLGANALTGCGPKLAVSLARTTLLGATVATGAVSATDTLFAGPLVATGPLKLDHCYVADLQWSPITGPPPAALTDAPAGASVVVERCEACDGVRAIRLWRCQVTALTLDPATIKACACDPKGPSQTQPCEGCAVAGCAASCPLKASGQVWLSLPAAPNFYPDNLYPYANFARLSDDNPPQLLNGASDQGEIGAFNAAQMQARDRQFDTALRDALLFGAGLDVTFVS